MLSRVFTGVIVGGIILIIAAVININSAEADAQTDFIPISVLANNQADYGVDDNLNMIPSISLDIIADKLQDEGLTASSLPVILFTSGNESRNKDETQTPSLTPEENLPDLTPTKINNGIGTNQEKDKNNNGNGQDKDKEKKKEQDKVKDKVKENEKDKNNDNK